MKKFEATGNRAMGESQEISTTLLVMGTIYTQGESRSKLNKLHKNRCVLIVRRATGSSTAVSGISGLNPSLNVSRVVRYRRFGSVNS